MPALIIFSIISGVLELGPKVQTIFVFFSIYSIFSLMLYNFIQFGPLNQLTARMRLKTCCAVLVILRNAVSLFMASSSGMALSTIEKKASMPC